MPVLDYQYNRILGNQAVLSFITFVMSLFQDVDNQPIGFSNFFFQ